MGHQYIVGKEEKKKGGGGWERGGEGRVVCAQKMFILISPFLKRRVKVGHGKIKKTVACCRALNFGHSLAFSGVLILLLFRHENVRRGRIPTNVAAATQSIDNNISTTSQYS